MQNYECDQDKKKTLKAKMTLYIYVCIESQSDTNLSLSLKIFNVFYNNQWNLTGKYWINYHTLMINGLSFLVI